MSDLNIPKSDVKTVATLIEDELWKSLHQYVGRHNDEKMQRKIMKIAAKTIARGIKFRIGITNSEQTPGKITINVTPYFKG